MILTCKECSHTGTPVVKQNGPHLSAYCAVCNRFLKHLPKDPVNDDFVFYWGKYKGTNLKSMTTPDEMNWLKWAYYNADSIKDHHRELIGKWIGL